MAGSGRWARGLCVQGSGAGHAGCFDHHGGVSRAIHRVFKRLRRQSTVCQCPGDTSVPYAPAITLWLGRAAGLQLQSVHLFAGIGICVTAACFCADLGRIRLFLELKNELRKEIGGER